MRIPRWLPLLLGSLTAVGPISIDMYLPAFPQIEAALGGEPGTAQFTLAAFFAGLAVGQLIRGQPVGPARPARAAACRHRALHARLGRLRAGAQSVLALGVPGTRRSRRIGQHGDPPCHRARPRRRARGGAADVAAHAGDGGGADPGTDARRHRARGGGWQAIFWVIAGYGAICGLLVWLFLPDTLPVQIARAGSAPGAQISRYVAVAARARLRHPHVCRRHVLVRHVRLYRRLAGGVHRAFPPDPGASSAGCSGCAPPG